MPPYYKHPISKFRPNETLTFQRLKALKAAHGNGAVALLLGLRYAALFQWNTGRTRPSRCCSWLLWLLCQLPMEQREALILARRKAAVTEGEIRPHYHRQRTKQKIIPPKS